MRSASLIDGPNGTNNATYPPTAIAATNASTIFRRRVSFISVSEVAKLRRALGADYLAVVAPLAAR
jgi:hypothetical protein